MRERSKCHPTRFSYKDGVCQRCWRLGLNVPRVRTPPAIDAELARLQKNWLEQVPESCPKCHKVSTIQQDGASLQCAGKMAGCGWTGYLVKRGKFAGSVRPSVPITSEDTSVRTFHGGWVRSWKQAITVLG